MAWVRLSEDAAKEHMGLTKRSLMTYKRQGAPGFKMADRKVFFDPAKVREWIRDTNPHKPGPGRPKANPPPPVAAPADAPDASGLLDPELQAALEKFRAGLGDGPLEEEVALCRRLFGRLSGLVLSWSEKRLEQPEDQAAFCDLTKTLAQVASRIERMEGRLIDLRRRHGELLPRDDVMRLLQGLVDDVKRGSDTLADELVAAAQVLLGDAVDTDALRAKAAAAVGRWRDGLAKAAAPVVDAERAA